MTPLLSNLEVNSMTKTPGSTDRSLSITHGENISLLSSFIYDLEVDLVGPPGNSRWLFC